MNTRGWVRDGIRLAKLSAPGVASGTGGAPEEEEEEEEEENFPTIVPEDESNVSIPAETPAPAPTVGLGTAIKPLISHSTPGGFNSPSNYSALSTRPLQLLPPENSNLPPTFHRCVSVVRWRFRKRDEQDEVTRY